MIIRPGIELANLTDTQLFAAIQQLHTQFTAQP